MKKYFLLLLLYFSFCKFSAAQILCIYCYDQNAPVSTGVNNLVVNGSFENSNCTPGYTGDHFCPNSSTYSCNISNWTCTGGGIDTYACIFDTSAVCRSIIAEGIMAAYLGNHFCNACSPTANDTSCLNNLLCEVTGIPVGYPVNTSNYGGTAGVSLEHTVTGLIIGNTYVLEFWAGGEQIFNTFSRNGIFAADVGFGDTLLREKPTPRISGVGTRYIIEFNATSSSHTIKFTNWGHICNHCTELVLDDVRLYTLAELDASVPHCMVGLDYPDFENLENLISPNPVTNELNIKTNSSELSEIILYDIALKKIVQQTFIKTVSINTEQFSKGVYFYEIRNEEGVVRKGKVIKE